MSTTYIISKFKKKLGLSITIKYTIKITMLCMWFLYSYGFIYIMGVSGSCCRYSLRYSHFSFQGENNPLRFYWKYILVIKISMKNSTKMVIFQFYTVTDHLIDIETWFRCLRQSPTNTHVNDQEVIALRLQLALRWVCAQSKLYWIKLSSTL